MVGRDCASVPEGPEVLAGIETPGDRRAMGTDTLTFVASTVCLRRVLQDTQPMLPCNLQNRVNIRRLPVQMDRENNLGARRYSRFYASGIEVVCRFDRFDRDRRRSALADRQPSCNVS